MKGATYEGIVENGNVRLPDGIHLPEMTKVYVVVPDVEPQRGFIFAAHAWYIPNKQ